MIQARNKAPPEVCVLIVALVLGTLAATDFAHANVIGVDTQNFNPTTSGLDFVTVQSSETLHPGVINLGLFVNEAVNSLPYFTTEASPSKRDRFKDQLIGADLNAGLGLARNWDLGISFPQVLAQTVKSEDFHGQFASNGLSEVRLNTKYRLFGNDAGGLAVIGTINHNMIQDNPYAGDGAGPTMNVEVAADTTVGPAALGINLGYRKRKPGTDLANVPVVPLKDQYLASAAASYFMRGISTKLIAEIFASRPTQQVSNQSDRQLSSAEALLGVKHDVNAALALHLGAGTELVHSVSSPDYRIYAGLNYALGPVFQKKKVTQRRKSPRKSKPTAPPVADFPQNDSDSETEISEPTPPQDNPFAGTPESGVETIVISDVHFAFDKDNVVLPGTRSILSQLYEYLMKEPVYKKLVISGHTDSDGSDAYNQNLSDRRAATIRKYLIQVHRLEADSVEAYGFGEQRPVADNGNYQGRQLNRRVEFRIYRD